MSDGSLSQDEIDALLRGTEDIVAGSSGGGGGAAVATSFAPPTSVLDGLNDSEKATATEILRAAIEAAGTNMGVLLSSKVSLGGFTFDVMRLEDVRNELGGKLVQVSMSFADGIMGENVFVLPEPAALTLTNIAMGQSNQELSPMAVSTVAQTVTQAFAAAASNLSARLSRMVRFSEARAESVDGSAALTFPMGGSLVRLNYQLRIEGQNPIQVAQILSVSSVREIVNAASGFRGDMNFGSMGAPSGGGFVSAAPTAPQVSSQIGVSAVQYPQLQQGMGSAQMPHNISVLMDVQMQLSVELGRTRKKISEILAFGEGSILELDKLAGEPVDVLVNGKLIAKGEVVVIDENFGVRVTEIVSPSSRIEYSQ